MIGENMAAQVPQVSTRARVYQLEDDGASDLARRKRAAKDKGDLVARHERAIAAIEKQQAGETALPPREPAEAERLIEYHRKAIRRESRRAAQAPVFSSAY